ncbi:MAG: sulfatase-like hydrolase/transferase [Tepidisphaerales bacterium]
MKRRQFIGLCIGAAAAAVGAAGAWWRWGRRGKRRPRFVKKPHPTRKDAPNIVVILIDDLGYADVGYYPECSKDIKTPHIDALAGSGAWFSAGYVCSPVCSPSRAGVLTGMYPQRCGFEFNVAPLKDKTKTPGLPADVPTLAERLQSAGYATGLVGKWHLGAVRELRPNARGFDDFFGFIPGSRSYWGKFKKGRTPLYRDEEAVDDTEYLTDTLAAEAEAFIDRHKDQSFFLYVPFNAVHSPYEDPPRKYLDRFKDVADAGRRTMLAITSAMDDGVGRIMGKLRACGIDEKTLVFFLSDNGGTGGEGGSHNGNLRRGKGATFEGGVRVPFAVRWPGKIKPARFDKPVSALDIAPTALAVAGVKADGLDGVNLLPYLSGENPGSPHDVLYWRYGDRVGIRKDHWKWADNGELGKGLFDLDKDPGEGRDLSAQHPEILRDLQARWKEWSAQMKPPAWDMPNVYEGPEGDKGEVE